MASRWTVTVIWASTLASAFPSGVLSAHVAREAGTCHRLASHVIPCCSSQTVNPRHFRKWNSRSLAATQTKRVPKRAVADRRGHLPTPSPRPPRRIPGGALEPSGGILNAKWVEPPPHAP